MSLWLRWFAEITPSWEAPAYAVTSSLKSSSPFFVQQQISRLGWKRTDFYFILMFSFTFPSFIFHISFILTELVRLLALFPSLYVELSSEEEQPSENCDNPAL